MHYSKITELKTLCKISFESNPKIGLITSKLLSEFLQKLSTKEVIYLIIAKS